MPPKKSAKPVDPKARRVTRSRAASKDLQETEENQPRTQESSDSSGTVVPGSSPGTSVLNISDSTSDSSVAEFGQGINIASTQKLKLPPVGSLPPQVQLDYTQTEFDIDTNYITAADMSQHDDENVRDGLFDQDNLEEQLRNDRQEREQQLPPVIPPVLFPGAQVDFMQFMQWQETQRQAEREADRKRSDEMFRLMREEIKASRTSSRPAHTPRSSAKLPTFNMDKDKATFYTWKEKWEAYLIAHGLDTIPDGEECKRRCKAEFTTAMSDNTLRWIGNQNFTDEEAEDPEVLIDAIEAHIKGATNPLVQNIELVMLKKRSEQSVDDFVDKIKEKAKLCELEKIENPADYLPMLCLIAGHDDANVRKKLMLAKVKTFANAVEICQEEERAAKTSKQFVSGSSADVNATSTYKKDQKSNHTASQNRGHGGHRGSDRGRGGNRGGRGGHFQNRGRSESRGQSQDHSRSQSQARGACYRCGKDSHVPNDCWAKDKKCNNCDKIGHIKPVCRSAPSSTNATSTSSIELSMGSVTALLAPLVVPEVESLDTIEVTISIPGGGPSVTLDALPDTGANVTAIPLSQALHFKIRKTDRVLKAADGKPLKTVGTVTAFVQLQGKSAIDHVYVVDGLTRALLSRRVLKDLGLVHKQFPHQDLQASAASQDVTRRDTPNSVITSQVNPPSQNVARVDDPNGTSSIMSRNGSDLDSLMNEFPELFDEQCKVMKNGTYHIDLEDGATPMSSGACRTIPEPYMPAVKKELDALQAQGIIRKIDYATPWLHPIVVVPKKGTTDIRICVDFTRLNKYVKRPVNPQPTPWETVRNLPRGTTHFAVFDALKGYHQIELDKESQDLTAFMTPFGRYVYLRLAFGLSSAGDVFTLRYGNAIDEATDGMRATEDTLIRGSTAAELLANTRRFFNACREAGITLNKRKIQWDKKEVLFGGFLLDKNGYRIDPSLTKALSEFPTPTTPTDVRSFFGLANQICNSSDEISRLLAPLKSLLKKGVMFQWLPEHQTAFETAREHLASPKVLAYYSPKRQTRLVVDASRLNGLGFVLKQLQEDDLWKPVQAGSRFLTSAETRYAMVELEMLAIAWACQKARIFVEGLPRAQFEIWTDHAPLVPILEKQTLPEIANKRLQRLKMKVEHLTFKTVWVKGIDNVEADALSRHPCARAQDDDELDEEIHVARVCLLSIDIAEDVDREINALHPLDRDITDDRLRELKSFCEEDETYLQVVKFVERGFPNNKREDIPEKLRPFYKEQDDLYIDSDRFLCRRGAFVVPEGLVQTYLKRLLAMHQAAPKMLARARQSIWWPYMSRDIGTFAKTCETCEQHKPSNPSESLRQHEEATYAFQALHMDIGEVAGKYYLFMIDQFSSYPHIDVMGNTATTQQVIDATMKLITMFSIPEVIYSDGGPQFLENGKFADFCKQWGIRHVTSSPYMSRSNGVAEECVKEMKKIIRANISGAGILDQSSALAGLIMFRNTPRSPTDLSPAQILFGHPIRDNLPHRRNQLVPTQRFEVERRLQDHRQRQREAQGTQRELPILHPGQRVRVQDPRTKQWSKTGTIVSFGKNTREYSVRVEDVLYRRNRKFLKPKDIESNPPVRQPAQAPSRPAIRPSSPPATSFPSTTVLPRTSSPKPGVHFQRVPLADQVTPPNNVQQGPLADPEASTSGYGRMQGSPANSSSSRPKRNIVKPARFRD